MEARRILAGMSLDIPVSKEASAGAYVSIPINKTNYAIGISTDPNLCKFIFKKPKTGLVVKYTLTFKTYRDGARVEVPLYIGALKNGTLIKSQLAEEPFYVNQEDSGLRGTLFIPDSFNPAEKLGIVIINKGFSCGIEFKSVDINLFDGSSGSAGTSDPCHYKHTQGVPASKWYVNHNLGFNPNVTAVDSLKRQWEGEVTYIDTNKLTIEFIGSFSGEAYCS